MSEEDGELRVGNVAHHEQRDEDKTGQNSDRKQTALFGRLHKHQQRKSEIKSKL